MSQTCHRCCEQPARYECTERRSTWRKVCAQCFDQMGDERYLYVPPDGRAIASDEIPRGDLVAAMVELAATDERLCRIVLAADKLLEAYERHRSGRGSINSIEQASLEYKITRRGQ